MKLEIFAVRDRAMDQYMNPMFLVNTGHAIRNFGDVVNNDDANNQVHKHPEDYDLYRLGEFDTTTGLFNTGVPQQVAIGKDIAIKANGA